MKKVNNVRAYDDIGVLLIILDTENADFDGDVLNTLAEELPEFHPMFAGFSPINMLIDRVSGSLQLTISNLESCSIAILSDH